MEESGRENENALVEPLIGTGLRSHSLPAGVRYLVWTEVLLRFSSRGIQVVLALFLSEHLRFSENASTELVHVFIFVLDLSPAVGALVSDGYLGNYHTLLYFSSVQLVGNGILIVAAALSVERRMTLSFAGLGLLLTAVGSGGVRPCITAFGGDQVQWLIPEGADRDRLRRLFFSLYYVAMNSGSFLASLSTPAIRTNGSYVLVYSTQAAVVVASILFLWIGRRHYVHRPVQKHVFAKVFAITVDALRIAGSGDGGGHNSMVPLPEIEVEAVNYRQSIADDGGKFQWLDGAKLKHNDNAVEEVKTLLGVLVVFAPMPVFWSLFDQQFSKWVFQARSMNCELPWLGGLLVRPDQMPALNPILVLIMIPIFERAIYPFFAKLKILLTPLRKMAIGMTLAVLAFAASGALQLALDNSLRSTSTDDFHTGMVYNASNLYPKPLQPKESVITSNLLRLKALMDFQVGPTSAKVSVMWQLPQYVLITAGEVLVNITGLEFAYSQAPPSMKSVVQSAWNCTSAFGNLLTIAIVAIIGERLSKAEEFFCFAGGCAVATFLLVWISHGYSYSPARQVRVDPLLAEATVTV